MAAGSDTLAHAEGDSRLGVAGYCALLVVGLVLPFLLSEYQTYVASTVLVYTVALLGLNFVSGYGGQISLGHGAFYAAGAYTIAILEESFGVPFGASIPAAAVLCFLFGLLLGWPALRLTGPYLALATFALAIVTPQVLRHKSVAEWTGGSSGIFLSNSDMSFGLPLSNDQGLYFLCFGVTILAFVISIGFVRSRFGHAVIAVRDHVIAAESLGMNAAMIKTLTFGFSAMLTGIAGALSAILTKFVAPDAFTFLLSITLVVGLVVGGAGRPSGAVYGAIFIVMVPNWAGQISDAAPWAIYGAAVIAAVFLLPGGLAAAVLKAANGLQAIFRRAGGSGR